MKGGEKAFLFDQQSFQILVNEIFIATDPDREGNSLRGDSGRFFRFRFDKRISFNEITKDAVMSAISEPRDIDMDLVNAAIVRRLIDRLVGWRCSKFCKSWKLKSMGGYRLQL